MVNRRTFMVLLTVSALFLGAHLPAIAQQGTPPGQGDKTLDQLCQNKGFTRITYEEDLKDTLRSIAQLMGLPVTFGAGITDTVTMEFKDMPLKDAFEFLIDQHDLQYSLDANSLHIYKPGAGGVQDVLITLDTLDMADVKDAIDRFGLSKKELKIHYDGPTNSIFLTGTGRDIGNVRRLIDAMESSRKKPRSIRPEIRYFPLRYAKVSDTSLSIGKRTVSVPGLVSVLTKLLGLTRKGEDLVETGQGATDQGAFSSQDARARVIKAMIGAESGTIAPDPRTNRVIIRDYPEKLDEYALLIKELDQPMKMVKLDVIIVEAGKDFARELGIGWTGYKTSTADRRRYYLGTSGQARDVFDERFTQSENYDALTLMPLSETAAGTPISSYGLAGTFLYSGAQWNLAASLALAETKGVSRTINKSSVVTMDNMESIIESKTTVTYKVQTGGDNPTVDSEDIDAGIVLTVTPHIIEADEKKRLIELVVKAERSSFLTTRTDGIPEKATTNLTTQAVIGDNSTLVVGGFFEDRYRKGETGLPCLMNMPALGYLFKTAAASNPKSNILFFMTPTVITLDEIPYEGPEINRKVESSERELKRIDPEKDKEIIERGQD
ncbi:MAG: type III secretion system outer membrane ring subunit SctC [Deltaproteobacteria bacterium]|nr:type III secretion system outer membrane ring subunit SctC [Deltaproteobacteria bacterium]